MNLFKAKLITILLAFGCITGAAVGALLYNLFPAYYPNWFFEIVIFFLLLETVIVSAVASASETSTAKKMLNIYMLAKVLKIIVSLIFVTIYALAVKENIKSFVLVFMVFYLLYIGIETYLYSKIEKHIKVKNNSI